MEQLLEKELPVDPVAAPAARMLVGETVSFLPPPRLADVALLTHELVMNGVRHGSSTSDADTIRLRVERGDGRLRVEVVDRGAGFGNGRRGRAGRAGLGLRLVAGIAAVWGISRRDRTCVWFEMDLPRDA